MAILITGAFSCQKEEDLSPPTKTAPNPNYESLEGMTKVGKQLQNPYSVENMRKAYSSLKSNPNARVNEEIEITTTHQYIKFKPKNEAELDILKRDTTLILFSYPLDHEIIHTGSYYHDPNVLEGQPTYQYSSVELNKKLPDGVDYEVLAELFIPDEEKAVPSSNRRFASKEVVKALVNEALRITGNLNAESASNGRIEAIASWRPKGTVRVWDTRAGRYVPVVDVQVRAKRWFTVHTGNTNSLGQYTCNGTFDNPADYSIHWERYHFSIRSGTFDQAESIQLNVNGDWSPSYGAFNGISGTFGLFGSSWTVDKPDQVTHEQQYYATIFQAARDYYHGNRFGLSSPPRNSALHPQVKIAADMSDRQMEKASHAAMYARTFGIFPSIYVRRWGSGSDYVYAVTAHELAHAAHWDMDRDAFKLLVLVAGSSTWSPMSDIPASEAVIESWANGVEWQFAQERYRNLFGIAGYEYENDVFVSGFRNGNYQSQRIDALAPPVHLKYTSLVVDMIDNDNQRFTRGHGGSVGYPQDRVSGYTIREIEQGLRGAPSWAVWRNNMINRHDNPTEGFLVELFGNWY